MGSYGIALTEQDKEEKKWQKFQKNVFYCKTEKIVDSATNFSKNRRKEGNIIV